MKVRYISIDTNVFHCPSQKKKETINNIKNNIKDYKLIINTIEERFIHK